MQENGRKRPEEGEEEQEQNSDRREPEESDDPVAAVHPISRSPDFNVMAAEARLKEYCRSVLNLYENVPIAGDGACLFRAVAAQLASVRPELKALSPEEVRRSCVAWVYKKYHTSGKDGLRLLGYANWSDWREKMSAVDHYGDELCVEAVFNVYRVRIMSIYCGEGEPSHRFMGNDSDPTIYLGSVGDHHFYSFLPQPQRELGQPTKKRATRAPRTQYKKK